MSQPRALRWRGARPWTRPCTRSRWLSVQACTWLLRTTRCTPSTPTREANCGASTWRARSSAACRAAISARTASPGRPPSTSWTAASADATGNLLVATGNSQDVGTTADLGESVVKLSSTLQQLDFFTAPEWRSLNLSDTDVGSIAPTVLQNGSIFQSGKNGKGY